MEAASYGAVRELGVAARDRSVPASGNARGRRRVCALAGAAALLALAAYATASPGARARASLPGTASLAARWWHSDSASRRGGADDDDGGAIKTKVAHHDDADDDGGGRSGNSWEESHHSGADDDGEFKTRVHVDPNAIMKLQAQLYFSDATAADGAIVAVEYRPVADGSAAGSFNLLPLWSRNVTMVGGLANVTIARLRPDARYHFHVYLSADGASAATLVDSIEASIPATGFPRFDSRALATISGGVPEWQMLTMVYEVPTAGHSDQEFMGIVGVDQEGWVVWYYPVNSKGRDGHGGLPAVWDFLPASEGYAVVLLEVAYAQKWKDAKTGKYWNANSMMAQVSPLGELVHQYVQACTGTPENYNQITHELRVDSTSDDLRVLTSVSKLGLFPDTRMHVQDGPADDNPWKAEHFQGIEIAAWHRADGTLQPLYDLFDYASPDKKSWNPTEPTWTKTEDISCSGDATLDAVDYHHVSAVSVGVDGTMLVTSRNLNTIFAFDAVGSAAGGGLRWKLSSLPGESDFAFSRPLDEFYAPHNAIMLDDWKILLIDDGSSRPGCLDSSSLHGCWSRAAMYELDFKTNTTTLAWQFEDPNAPNGAARGKNAEDDDKAKARYYEQEVMVKDLYNYDGGSAYRLDGGRILVAFTSPYDSRSWDEEFAMRAYEVDKDGDVIVNIVVPHESDALEAQGAYRFIPMKTVLGETTSAPLAISYNASSS